MKAPGAGSTTAGATTAALTLEREFDATAYRYDLMVGLNPGYHEHLHAAADVLVAALPAPSEPLRLLDLGCGSGASTVALLDQLGDHAATAEVVGVDASDGMLDVARGKTWAGDVRFVHGLAEDVATKAGEWGLPVPVDGVFACYLFRNVGDRDATLSAVHDVLRPGGRLVTQEYSVAGSRRSAVLWSAVCWTVVIPLSLVLTRRTTLYRYLWRSVLRFDSVARFTARLRAAGFEDIQVTTVDGWQRGILHTFSARRPAAAGDAR